MSVGSDTFASAPTISPGTVSDPTSNIGYGHETGEPTGGYTRSAWWKFTADQDGWVRFDTLATTRPPGKYLLTAVYTGSAVNALTEIDNSDSSGVDWVVKVPVENGTTYYIQVSVDPSADIDYVLTMSNYAVLTDYTDEESNLVTYTSGEMLPFPDAESGGTGQPAWLSYASWDEGTMATDYLAKWETVWGGGGIVSGSVLDGMYLTREQITHNDGGFDWIYWQQSWATATRADGFEVTEGATFLDPYGDADLAALEWEPTSEPESQYLAGSIRHWLPGGDPGYLQVRLAYSDASEATVSYDPGFMTRGVIMSDTEELTGTGLDFSDWDGGWTSSGDVEVDLPDSLPGNGALQLTVGLVSRNLVENEPMAYDDADKFQTWYFDALNIVGRYRPRYRMWRFDVVAGNAYYPLRQLQRSDGLAASSAPRVAGSVRSIQRSLRVGPGAYL